MKSQLLLLISASRTSRRHCESFYEFSGISEHTKSSLTVCPLLSCSQGGKVTNLLSVTCSRDKSEHFASNSTRIENSITILELHPSLESASYQDRSQSAHRFLNQGLKADSQGLSRSVPMSLAFGVLICIMIPQQTCQVICLTPMGLLASDSRADAMLEAWLWLLLL